MDLAKETDCLLLKKQTSLGANGWARWPPSLYLHREYIQRKFGLNAIMGF